MEIISFREIPEVSLEEASILKNEKRYYATQRISEEQPSNFPLPWRTEARPLDSRELAEYIGGKIEDKSTDKLTSNEIKKEQTSLTQSHFPLMIKEGYLEEYESRSQAKQVRPTEKFDNLKQIIPPELDYSDRIGDKLKYGDFFKVLSNERQRFLVSYTKHSNQPSLREAATLLTSYEEDVDQSEVDSTDRKRIYTSLKYSNRIPDAVLRINSENLIDEGEDLDLVSSALKESYGLQMSSLYGVKEFLTP